MRDEHSGRDSRTEKDGLGEETNTRKLLGDRIVAFVGTLHRVFLTHRRFTKCGTARHFSNAHNPRKRSLGGFSNLGHMSGVSSIGHVSYLQRPESRQRAGPVEMQIRGAHSPREFDRHSSVTRTTPQQFNKCIGRRIISPRTGQGDEMDHLRSLGTWIVTAMVTLAAGAGLVAFNPSPQLFAAPTTKGSSPPTTTATSAPPSPRVVTSQPVVQVAIQEAAMPVVRVNTTTTTPLPSTTTSTTTTTSSTTTTTTTTSTTTTLAPPPPPTTTTTVHHHDDGGGGGSDDS